jgi:S-DNA-T family DNA segregation ATPase FtsK/SpoIIIE
MGPDLASVPGFVVAGPAKSGRSTVLAVMAESLLRTGATLVLVAPRPSPLRDLTGRPGVAAALITDPATPPEEWKELVLAEGVERLVVVIDDGEVLKDSPGGEVFRSIVKGMAGAGRALVLGGNADGIATGLSGWQVDVKKSRAGVLLSPQNPTDGDLLGVRLPRSAVGNPVKPGRGLLHLGDGRLVSVALPRTGR